MSLLDLPVQSAPMAEPDTPTPALFTADQVAAAVAAAVEAHASGDSPEEAARAVLSQ